MKWGARVQHYWRNRLGGAKRAHAFDVSTNAPLCTAYGESPRGETTGFGPAHSVGRERPFGTAICTLCETAVRARLMSAAKVAR